MPLDYNTLAMDVGQDLSAADATVRTIFRKASRHHGTRLVEYAEERRIDCAEKGFYLDALIWAKIISLTDESDS